MRRRHFAAVVVVVAVAVGGGGGGGAAAAAAEEKAWCEAVPGALATHDLSGPRARAARPETKPVRFVVAMMGPRVGSKMVRSMLERWGRHDAVYAGGEKQEELIDARYGGRAPSAKKLARFFGDPAFARGRRVAVGYKTEHVLAWDAELGAYAPGAWYGDNATATLASLGVRVDRPRGDWYPLLQRGGGPRGPLQRGDLVRRIVRERIAL